jgi:hypothetical protein
MDGSINRPRHHCAIPQGATMTDAWVESAWRTYNNQRPRGDISAKPAFQAGWRAALAAAQAGAPYLQGELRWLDEFVHTILHEFEGVLPDPERYQLTPLEKGREAFIADARAQIRSRVDRALRPPAAPAESTSCLECGMPTPWHKSKCSLAPPLSASEQAGAPSKVLLTGIHPYGKSLRDK